MTDPRTDSICGFELTASRAKDDDGTELSFVVVTIERRHEGEDEGEEPLVEHVAEAFIEDGHMDLYFHDGEPVHFCGAGEIEDFGHAVRHSFCLASEIMRGVDTKETSDVN